MKYTLIIVAATIVLCCTSPREEIQSSSNLSDQPNIILIVADDHGMDDTGAYGNTAISTPNLDYLASEGVRYNRAYATAPSCTASRSVILTGLYNHLNGLYGHAHSYHHFQSFDFMKSLPIYLEELGGYATARIGKYHVAPAEVFRFQKTLQANGRNPVAMADTAARFMNETENPFFLYFCTQDPHRGGGINENNPLGPDRFGNKDEGYSGVEAYSIDPEDVIVPWYLPDLPETRAELVEYYKSVNRVDQGIGRLISHLKEAGKWDNTILLYISDNGIAFQGAKTNIYEPGVRLPLIVKGLGSDNKGTVSNAMVNWTDLTPTILDFAGILSEAENELKAGFQGFSNYVPETDFEVIDQFHGYSFKQTLKGEEGRRAENYASHTFHEITMYYPMRSITTDRYKLIWNIASALPYPHATDLWASATWQGALRNPEVPYGTKTIESYTYRPKFQLYDLKEDPQESVNLVNSPGHHETLRALQEKLRAFQLKTNDPWIIKWDHE
ncbi:MAG: sulfatase [Cyclobacteriaceae bacterium]